MLHRAMAPVLISVLLLVPSAGDTAPCEPVFCHDYGVGQPLVHWTEIGPLNRFNYSFTDSEIELAGETGWILTNYGSRIASYDLTDPAAPQYLGIWPQASAGEALTVAGNRGYTTGWGSLATYDLTDRTRARAISVFEFSGAISNACLFTGHVLVRAHWAGDRDAILSVDLSDESAPREVARFDIPVRTMSRAGDRLLVLQISRLVVFAVPSATELVELASVPAMANNTALYVHGNLAYIAGGDGVQIFDLSRGVEPEVVSTIAGLSVRAMHATDSRLYVADRILGVLTYDMGNPAAPALVSRIPGALGVLDLVAPGGHLVVTTDSGIMMTLDPERALTPPANPIAPLARAFTSCAVSPGGLLLATTHAPGSQQYGLLALDPGEPTTPTLSDELTTTVPLINARIHGNHVVCDGMTVVDVSDPLAMQVVAGPVEGGPVALRDSIAFLAGPSGTRSISVFDIRNVAQPTWLSTAAAVFDAELIGDDGATLVAVAGNRVSCLAAGNPAELVPSGEISLNLDPCVQLEVRDGLAYYLSAAGDLAIIDIATPAMPLLRSVFRAPNRSPGSRMSIGNGVAYLALRAFGAMAVDVSNPDLPVLIGFAPIGTATSTAFTVFALDSGRLLALRSGEGLAVVDRQCGDVAPLSVVDLIVEPRDRCHRIPCGNRARGTITVAILSTGSFDAHAVDAATVRLGPGEAAPIRSGHRRGGHDRRFRDVDCDGDLDLELRFDSREVAVACGDSVLALRGTTTSGLEICGEGFITTSRHCHRAEDSAGGRDCRGEVGMTPEVAAKTGGTTVAAPTLVPNPFNPAAEVHFEIVGEARVRIEVFDLAGRRVIVLADGQCGAGPQRVVWDGRDQAGLPAPSGVYFVRIVGGGLDATLRAALIR